MSEGFWHIYDVGVHFVLSNRTIELIIDGALGTYANTAEPKYYTTVRR